MTKRRQQSTGRRNLPDGQKTALATINQIKTSKVMDHHCRRGWSAIFNGNGNGSGTGKGSWSPLWMEEL
jgi:hypothetical protein